jgi:heme/copper-type cytochrome/quinol oxidase subunit 4
MRTEAAFVNPTNPVGPERRLNKAVSELVCALICPPVLTVLLGLIFEIWWESEAGGLSAASISQVLIPLMMGGTILLSAVIALECWAGEKLGTTASDFRTALGFSASVALTFLAVWVTAQAERNRVSAAAELVTFMCLPVLLVCALLLWFSAKAIQSTPRRLLMLTVFTSMTALLELQCHNKDYGNAEEQLFSLHSLLIALALGIRLCTWGHKQFRQR